MVKLADCKIIGCKWNDDHTCGTIPYIKMETWRKHEDDDLVVRPVCQTFELTEG